MVRGIEKAQPGFWRLAAAVAQSLAQGIVVVIAVILVLVSGLAAFGALPWPEIALSYGGAPLPHAGIWLQLSGTALAVILTFFLPANHRMARLERSHRSFAMGIEDVARAYRLAHATDRAGVFTLATEFDSVRARMEHLRDHPDLPHLEPELLQMAAQMSHQTRDLARAYSDERVERAKIFLRQRQQEVHALHEQIAAARLTCDELRRWLMAIEAEEHQAQVQIRRLEADLKELLPSLGYDFDLEERLEPREANVVSLPKPAK